MSWGNPAGEYWSSTLTRFSPSSSSANFAVHEDVRGGDGAGSGSGDRGGTSGNGHRARCVQGGPRGRAVRALSGVETGGEHSEPVAAADQSAPRSRGGHHGFGRAVQVVLP